MKYRSLLCVVFLFAAPLINGCSSGGSGSASDNTVHTDSSPVLEKGVDPESLVCALDATTFAYRIFDTDGDSKIDALIAGDFNKNGVLEWDDVNEAVKILCDSNKLDSNGQPFCGSLYIPAGNWVSRITLDTDTSNLYDDQILIHRAHKLTFKGCGVDVTTFTVRYSRTDYCKYHKATGGGGIFLLDPQGDITLSGFSYTGLPGRTWGSKLDCDGDGADDGGPRTSQTGISVYAASGADYKKNLLVENIKVSQVDYLGFIFTNWENVTIRNLQAKDYGATGFNISSIKNAVISNLYAGGSQGTIAEAGLNIESERDGQGLPQPQKLENVLIDGYTCRDNYRGLSINALGGGGITNLVIRNIDIQDIGLRRSAWHAYVAAAIAFSDSACVWDAENGEDQHLGPLNDFCYLNGITIDGGVIKNVAGSGISSVNLRPSGPGRNLVFRGLTFEAVGQKLGGADSQGISLNGGNSAGTASGLLFESNTIAGGDASGDGIPDLTQLMRLDSAHHAILRNNTFIGRTSGGPSTLLNLTNTTNVEISGNNYVVEQPNGRAILLGNGALNNIILNNFITIPQTGVAIADYNSAGINQYSGNSVTIK